MIGRECHAINRNRSSGKAKNKTLASGSVRAPNYVANLRRYSIDLMDTTADE